MIVIGKIQTGEKAAAFPVTVTGRSGVLCAVVFDVNPGGFYGTRKIWHGISAALSCLFFRIQRLFR